MVDYLILFRTNYYYVNVHKDFWIDSRHIYEGPGKAVGVRPEKSISLRLNPAEILEHVLRFLVGSPSISGRPSLQPPSPLYAR